MHQGGKAHASCPVRAPLFPILLPRDAPRILKPSHTSFSDMILKAPKHAGANSHDYSGVCARRGCISTATKAKVPEAVLWLHCGHTQTLPSRVHIKLAKPDLLFATWASFNL